MELPFIDVVVPTFNRAALLEKAVQALQAQSYPPQRYRVIVVDDGSTDETGMVLSRLAERRANLRPLRIEHAGAYAARNRGWQDAKGRIVAFTDDDCLADAQWLSAAARAFAENPSALGVQGKTVTLPRLTTPLTHQIVISRLNPLYQTCNIAYQREALETVGGFDEALRQFADTALGAAVSRRGPLIFCPDMMITHPPRPRAFLSREEWTERLVGELSLYRRDREFYRRVRGRNFFLGVTVHWLIGSAMKQAALNLPWLARDPWLYLRAIGIMAHERAILLSMLPSFWREHRRGGEGRDSGIPQGAESRR